MTNTPREAAREGSPSASRADMDRRVRPTRVLSRYWLVGRRAGGRRDGERENLYVDRYSGREYLLIGCILVLSLLDMIFTLVHLNAGGTEANPIMAWTLSWGGDFGFKVVKVATTLAGLFVLLVHIRFRRVKMLLSFALTLYFAVFIFHLYLSFLRA